MWNVAWHKLWLKLFYIICRSNTHINKHGLFIDLLAPNKLYKGSDWCWIRFPHDKTELWQRLFISDCKLWYFKMKWQGFQHSLDKKCVCVCVCVCVCLCACVCVRALRKRLTKGNVYKNYDPKDTNDCENTVRTTSTKTKQTITISTSCKKGVKREPIDIKHCCDGCIFVLFGPLCSQAITVWSQVRMRSGKQHYWLIFQESGQSASQVFPGSVRSHLIWAFS